MANWIERGNVVLMVIKKYAKYVDNGHIFILLLTPCWKLVIYLVAFNWRKGDLMFGWMT